MPPSRCGIDELKQIGRNQYAAQHHAQLLRATELAAGRPTKINGQKVVAGVIEPTVEQAIDFGIGRPQAQHAFAHNDGDGTKQRRTDNKRQRDIMLLDR